MPRAKPVKTSFVAGEISPRLEGRSDLDQYFQGCRKLENAVVLPHGGARRRSGTRFVEAAHDETSKVAMYPFVAAEDAAYTIEAGDQYFRFYTNEAIVGAPLVITTPYTGDEVLELQFSQANDVAFIVHPNHQVKVLRRTAADTFTLTDIDWTDDTPPFQSINRSSTTITVTGTGPYTLAWSASVGLTTEKDIGRYVIVDAATSDNPLAAGDVFKITSVSGGGLAVADKVQENTGTSDGAGATTGWALSLTSDTEGFRATGFHENRLWFGGSPAENNRIVGSQSDDFTNFKIGTGLDSESISRLLVGERAPNIQWIASAGSTLHIGALGQEFILRGTDDNIITPSGIFTRQSTGIGSENIAPIVVDNRIIFVQQGARTLREIGFSLSSDSFSAADLTILCEHILRTDIGGAIQLAYAQEQDSTILCVRADGQLVGITRETNQQVTGAFRFIIGGSYAGGDARIESCAVIPAPDKTHDQIWVSVLRTINGSQRRYIELIENPFDPAIDPQETDDFELIQALELGFFVDSGLSLDAPIDIGSISNATHATIVASAHGLTDGDRVRARDVIGMIDVNFQSFFVTSADTNTFAINSLDGSPIDSSSFSTYVASGTVREEFTTLSGLGHLVGETVSILADGAPLPNQVVTSSGQITLDEPASIIHVGLPFTTDIETQRVVGVTALGPGHGDKHRIKSVSMRLYETQGVQVTAGPNPSNLRSVIFRRGNDPMDRAIPMQTRDVFVSLRSGWTPDPTALVRQDQPLPLTILSITADAESGER